MLREDVLSTGVLGRLSPREREVLGMTADGMTNTQIAAALGLTVHGVKFHLASVYRKLAVANRTEAAAFFIRNGGNAAAPHPEAGA